MTTDDLALLSLESLGEETAAKRVSTVDVARTMLERMDVVTLARNTEDQCRTLLEADSDVDVILMVGVGAANAGAPAPA